MQLYPILLVTLLFLMPALGKKWRALAMSGGGNKGAYQAAVFYELANQLLPEDVEYDVLTGVSAGSLNALALSLFDKSEAKEAADFAYQLWKSIPEHEAFQQWTGGYLEGLFLRKGLFDIEPGREWVKANIGNRTIQRKVSFAAVDADTAEYFVVDYNKTETQPEDLLDSAFASAAIPGIFSPVVRGDRTLIDGGVAWNLDVHSAIRRWKEVVDDEKDIIVDMVLWGNPHITLEQVELSKLSAIDHLMRAIQIKQYYNGMSDYFSSMSMYPDVEFRYLVVPTKDISASMVPLDFSIEQIDKCFDIGKQDALKVIELGPNASKMIASPNNLNLSL